MIEKILEINPYQSPLENPRELTPGQLIRDNLKNDLTIGAYMGLINAALIHFYLDPNSIQSIVNYFLK